jgi:tRNA modification GTPase
LVCDLPGTTRDYLTAELECDGVQFLLVDTAGAASQGATVHGDGPDSRGEVRENGTDPLDEVQQAARSLSAEQRRRADVQLLCIDSTQAPDADERRRLPAPDPSRLLVLTKVDLPGRVDGPDEAVRTSSITGEGIDALRRAVARALRESRRPAGDAVASTAARCRESLRRAAAGLQRALGLARTARGEELIAAEVRAALEELGKVVGAVYTDDVLDRIFSRFCIGK